MVEYDFSLCMYDISVKGDLLKIYPELNAYEEFVAAHNDNEIKIALLISDEGSPFLKVKDFKQKLLSIFDLLEISLKNDKGKQLFNEILNYANERIAAMCGLFLELQNNHDFTYWWNTNQLYYSLMSEMGKPREKDKDGKLEPIKDYVDRKLKIQKQAEPIKSDLLNVEAELFSDSKMKASIAKAKIKKIRTYAEMFADENSVT